MFHFFRHLVIRGVVNLSTHGWTIVMLLLIFLYISGYYLMLFFAETAVIEHYLWWFAVTITTVGYGDVAPATIGGQWTAIFIMIFGIGSIALLIGKIAEWVIIMSEKQMNGSLQLKVKDHILIMGYRGEKSNELIAEILNDMEDKSQKVVLCSSTLEQNPFDLEKVKYVKGELASEDVLKRSCCAQAESIIVTGDDDNQSFFAAFAVRQINTHAHLIVFMNNNDHTSKIHCLPADKPELNRVIIPSAIKLIAQEIQDPQSSNVLQQLMTNLQGATLYRLEVPAQLSKEYLFADLFYNFRKHYNMTVLAIKEEQEIVANPPMDVKISAGMSLFYVADQRIKDIDWDNI